LQRSDAMTGIDTIADMSRMLAEAANDISSGRDQ
jgi:hypothetical protein